MLPRERVIQAINHQESDYVPYGLHAVPAVWERVCRHYGLRDHHEAMAFVGNHIVKIGSDFNLQTSHTVLEDVPMANLVAFIEEARALSDRS